MPEHMLMANVEIITDGGRRRRWSAAEKLRIVEETLEDQTNILFHKNSIYYKGFIDRQKKKSSNVHIIIPTKTILWLVYYSIKYFNLDHKDKIHPARSMSPFLRFYSED